MVFFMVFFSAFKTEGFFGFFHACCGSERPCRDVARLIFANADIREHLVIFANITMEIDAFANIPATFANINCAKKVGPQLLRVPVIFANIRPRL